MQEFVGCSCNIVGFAVLWLICDIVLTAQTLFTRVMLPKEAHGKQFRP